MITPHHTVTCFHRIQKSSCLRLKLSLSGGRSRETRARKWRPHLAPFLSAACLSRLPQTLPATQPGTHHTNTSHKHRKHSADHPNLALHAVTQNRPLRSHQRARLTPGKGPDARDTTNAHRYYHTSRERLDHLPTRRDFVQRTRISEWPALWWRRAARWHKPSRALSKRS